MKRMPPEVTSSKTLRSKYFLFYLFVGLNALVLFRQNVKILDLASPDEASLRVAGGDVKTGGDESSRVVGGEIKIQIPSSWHVAILEAKGLLSSATEQNSNGANITLGEQTTQDLPSCLVPNKEKTSALVRKLLEEQKNHDSTNSSSPLVPLPIMNVGMPKCGSTTLYNFFQCTGLRATHWHLETNGFEGLCMRDAARIGLPPLQTCGNNTEAFMQMDVEFPFGFPYNKQGPNFTSRKHRDDCFFPQLSLLEELHAENPNMSFVMNFRPIDAWIKSIRGWYNMMDRFQACHLPNLPRGLPKDLNDDQEVVDTMTQFFCSHVQHIRNFVQAHPSHTLIELDLYDNDHSTKVLSALFPSKPSKPPSSECYTHENKSEQELQENRGGKREKRRKKAKRNA